MARRLFVDLFEDHRQVLIEVRTLYINYFTIPTSVQDF